MILISDKILYDAVKHRISADFYDIDRLPGAWTEARARISGGESLLFIGTKNIELLKDIWIHTADGALTRYSKMQPTAAGFPDIAFNEADARYIYVRPPKTYAIHGIDEAPRAEAAPLIKSYGKYGDERGWPALVIKNYDSAHVSGNYKGSLWYIFAISDPLAAAGADAWADIINRAAEYAGNKFFISHLKCEYPLYYKNEAVKIHYKLENLNDKLLAYTITFKIFDGDGRLLRQIGTREEAVNARDANTGSYDWYPDENSAGIYYIEASAAIHDRYKYGPERENACRAADTVRAAVYIDAEPITYPKVEIRDAQIFIDGAADFFIGTHLYPSSTFFELSYRDLKVHETAAAVKSMRKTGIKICRIWCDPILDELSLRGMELLIKLFAKNGIAVIFTVFTSWTHRMAINTREYNLNFEVASLEDENLIGLYMHNLAEQTAFTGTLGRRWSRMDNIIWDFSNEFSVVEPKEDIHLNIDWLDESYKTMEEPYRSIALFEQWALKIKESFINAGAKQNVIFGASCWNTGSENYRCTKKADIIADHGYWQLDHAGLSAVYQSSACIKKPFIMEEYGGVWTDNKQRAREYDGRYHYFLGAGNSAAINYEWGVLWLCDKLSGMPAYLKATDDTPFEDSPGFLFGGRYNYAKTWPHGGLGLCPWMASFEYGSSYPCVDYPSETARVMRLAGKLGEGMSPVPRDKSVYLILPFETRAFERGQGYTRYRDKIDAAITALWKNGVDFAVWQEDCIDSIPESAKLAIYPNELPLKPDMRAALDRLSGRGVRVYTGVVMDGITGGGAAGEFSGGAFTGGSRAEVGVAAPDWLNDENIGKIVFSESENARLLYRDTPRGRLMIMICEGRADYSVGELKLTVDNTASCLIGGALLQIEARGSVIYRSLELIKATCRCVIHSNDGRGIDESGDISLFAYEPGTIEIAGIYNKCLILDTDGRRIASEDLTYADGYTCVNITPDNLDCEIRLVY